MQRVLAQVGTLMMSFGLLLLATGTFNTFIGLRSGIEGFSPTVIGIMMSAFYIGTLIGSRLCGRIINRVGHIRAFTSFAALSAVVVLLHPFLVNQPVWILLRGLLGFASAGLYMCTESWINERVTAETRGAVLSMAATIAFLGFGGGQLMLNLGHPAGNELFMIAAILFALGIIPIALTRAIHPQPVESARLSLRALYDAAPSGVTTCAAAGMVTGSLFGIAPIFAQGLGMSTGQISAFMTALILSGLFLQLPIGWLSDRYDRRTVIAWVALAAGTIAIALLLYIHHVIMPQGLDWQQHAGPLLILAFLFGGASATLYPLSVAYVNDYLEPEQRVEASGGLVFAYGAGAVTGPVLAALAMEWMGSHGLFAYNATVATILVGFITHRMRRRAWAGIAEKESFLPVPEATGTPGGIEYDPRAEPAHEHNGEDDRPIRDGKRYD